MRRIRLIVAYDGTEYCGWQLQPNGVTIEEKLHEALTAVLGTDVTIVSASRTDAGVHSRGNVCVFDTDARIPGDKFSFALNQYLPDDIVVIDSREVASDWHPRKCNSTKTYEYRILNQMFPDPNCRRNTYFKHKPLDAGLMAQAAARLEGTHDFASFCSPHTTVKDTVRTVYSCKVEQEGNLITIRVSGSGFLYNMVRIIAGTLMDIGSGFYPPEQIDAILAAKDRTAAGPTAPACGLTMLGIAYETEPKEVGL